MDIPRWFTDELMHAGDEHLDTAPHRTVGRPDGGYGPP